jgi:hypothetical protein
VVCGACNIYYVLDISFFMFKFHIMVLALSRNASHRHVAKLCVMINKKLYVELLFIEKKEKRNALFCQ